MLVVDLIKQEWKKSFRSQGFYKNLAVTIMLIFFVLYFAVILLIIGFSLNKILEKADNVLNPMELFNGAMLYLMLFALAFRFIMQQLNTFDLPPYQVLPVKRSTLINFLLLKPLFSPANYFLLLAVIPFAIKGVAGYYSGSVALRFVLNFVLMVWFNSLMAAYLKRKFGSSIYSVLVILIILGSVVALEYFKIFSLFNLSRTIYNFYVLRAFGLWFPLGMVITAFFLNKLFFYQNYYPESFNRKIKGNKTSTSEISFLKRFGIIGELISLEIKLILRHKRPKSILIMSAFFGLYGLMFYTSDVYAKNNGMLFFVAMFMTGILMLMFGQWLISWDSRHFDCLMTRNIPVRTYIYANYYLMFTFNIICFALTTPYFLFGMKIVYLHLAAFLFNIGVNIYLLIYLSTYNTRRIDLSKSSAMNYQGTTYKSFLIVFPIMFLPMLIVWFLSTFFSLAVALWTLSMVGIVGVLLRKLFINACVNQFNRRKYKLAEGFREN
ncbi:MAG: DUF5687 family protein [Paludibacter sp.]